MDEKNKTDENNKNPAGRDNKKRISKSRKRRMEIIRKRIIFAAAVVLLALLIVFVVPRIAGSLRSAAGGGSGETQEVDVSQVRTLSFDTLSVNGSESRLSVDEFNGILLQLYNDGYVLVDVYDLTHDDETGAVVESDAISIPQGKKPLIIMQQDASYAVNSAEEGTANKLVLENGEIKAEYNNGTTTEVGDYDIVPILETFIEEHPDFSNNGARAVIGASGSCGVLGYRSTSYFSEEDNPYSSYGTFDTQSEAQSAKAVADEMISRGYRFANCGFDADISYGAEYSIVEEDLKSWIDEVEPIVNGTNIMILPKQTDIASWKGYSEDNKKYKLFSDKGYMFYFVGNNSTPFMFQAQDGYVRQTVYEISNYTDFENALAAIQ